MSEINGIGDQGLLVNNKFAEQQREASDELGADAFLQLLITSMKNQNPYEEQESGEFITQMAQFTVASNTDEMNETLKQLTETFKSGQALQASSLVGSKVSIPTDVATLHTGGVVEGSIVVPTLVQNLKMNVYNQAGEVIYSHHIGETTPGMKKFYWDGSTDSGETAKPGTYYIETLADFDGSTVQLGTMMSTNVDSVTLGSSYDEVVLNLEGIGPVPLSQISELL